MAKEKKNDDVSVTEEKSTKNTPAKEVFTL